MIKISDTYNLTDIYKFQMGFPSPYFFETEFESWKKSFGNDTDGEGRVLFKEISVKVAYEEDRIVGFVQYGKTAFGFDDDGEISHKVSYPIIRNLYFMSDRTDAGEELLDEAMNALDADVRVYAFFHYFGMSCFARHGKVFEDNAHIDALLRKKGFEVEHENVYYSSVLEWESTSEVTITPGKLTKGNQQYLEFIFDGKQIGGCEIHYVDDTTVYLRWIYVNDDMTGKGIGTKCMKTLKSFLWEKGIRRFDTDTALNNTTAQHYYEKNGFVREGITRSYFTKQE